MDTVLNGHSHVASDLLKTDRDRLLARVERALTQMAKALNGSGFTDYEVGQINLATRFAITGVVRERQRKDNP